MRYFRLLILVVFTPLALLAQEYRGAEIYSTSSWQYGKIEMRMRMAKGSGILSTFFTYKNGSEVSGTFWEEIDIEVFGKGNAESFQSNIITGNPRQYSEEVHDMPFSLADAYHTYTLEWTPNYIAWFIDGVEYRRSQGGQVNSLTNPQSFRMNIWSARDEFWVGPFDTQALPAYQFVNWISYSAYTPGSGDNGTDFTENWRDDFNSFDAGRWARADWTFDANQTPFSPQNVVVKDGYLVLAITQANQTGYNGTVPEDVNVNVQEPYNGTPHAIPGRIEAEEYDLGGEGLGFHEANANGNEGNASFRGDQVDIEVTGDTDGEYNIAYTLNGEWLAYTVNVAETGLYDIEVRVARDGANGSLHIEMDGNNITGAIPVPNTGAWQTYETVTINDVNLTAGEHEMRIVFDTDYMNLNYVVFTAVIQDADNDGTPDDEDACPNDPNKAVSTGDCGCGNPETDSDADGIADCIDTYPNDADNDGVTTTEDCDDNNDQVGAATTWYQDLDGDGLGNSAVSQEACTQPPGYVATAGDECPNDINKTTPGNCGCGNTEESCLDCAGVPNGTAVFDDCGVCGGINACTDCNGEPFGNAFIDNCDECVGGTTGVVACEQDCNGDWGGTAVIDACNECTGGNTGLPTVTDPTKCVATGIEGYSTEKLLVYPNPTKGEVYLQEKSYWKLMDITGNVLTSGYTDQVNLKSYSPGMYYLNIEDELIKVIKE